MYVESFEKLSGNDMFEGFAVDLAHELSLVLGFNYTIKLVDDGKVRRSTSNSNDIELKIFMYSMAVRPRPATGTECWARCGMTSQTL